MKKKFILPLFCILVSLNIYAQQAYQIVNNLMGEKDWFTLNEKYPRLKDSIQYVQLKLIAEGLLASHFNKPEEAIEKLNNVIYNHQDEIGSMGALSLIQTVMEQYEILGKYDSIVKISQTVTDQLKDAPIDLAWFEYYNNVSSV